MSPDAMWSKHKMRSYQRNTNMQLLERYKSLTTKYYFTMYAILCIFVISGYVGNPLSGCRHECESDGECGSQENCKDFKCQQACTQCGIGASCVRVSNHRAICECPKVSNTKYTSSLFYAPPTYYKTLTIPKNRTTSEAHIPNAEQNVMVVCISSYWSICIKTNSFPSIHLAKILRPRLPSWSSSLLLWRM